MSFISGGQLALGTNAFCHRSYCPGVVGLCICEISRGQSALGTSAFYNRSYCPGVVVLCTIGLHWHWVHLHSAMSYCLGVVGLYSLGCFLQGLRGLGMSAFVNR